MSDLLESAERAVVEQAAQSQRVGVVDLIEVLRQAEADAAYGVDAFGERFRDPASRFEGLHVVGTQIEDPNYVLLQTYAGRFEAHRTVQEYWHRSLDQLQLLGLGAIGGSIAMAFPQWSAMPPVTEVAAEEPGEESPEDRRERLIDRLFNWATNHDPEDLQALREAAWR